MYAVLLGAMTLGILATVLNSTGATDGYNYREGVSVWFRSLFALSPDRALMAGAPLVLTLHVLFGLAFFALVPCSRLVHTFAVPARYLFRPFVVYRRRSPGRLANRAPKRGWERV
ncbi:respiratory nitrate reductase subunit gamma [Streptomyces griseus]|uniref:respiratory nitrate reductase subunit gamma n=1 Tax=Streptomyces griseus TaxID=1911 RepID=UPI00099B4E75|nr:respiratory nitrate reductase subunit gamma [Streptomyces griseus]